MHGHKKNSHSWVLDVELNRALRQPHTHRLSNNEGPVARAFNTSNRLQSSRVISNLLVHLIGWVKYLMKSGWFSDSCMPNYFIILRWFNDFCIPWSWFLLFSRNDFFDEPAFQDTQSCCSSIADLIHRPEPHSEKPSKPLVPCYSHEYRSAPNNLRVWSYVQIINQLMIYL
jgi:hypothetical protein